MRGRASVLISDSLAYKFSAWAIDPPVAEKESLCVLKLPLSSIGIYAFVDFIDFKLFVTSTFYTDDLPLRAKFIHAISVSPIIVVNVHLFVFFFVFFFFVDLIGILISLHCCCFCCSF